MCALLIVYLLVVQSSRAHDVEQPSRGFGDSVQYCANERGAWRIRTFALDEQVEVQSLVGISATEVETLAESETRARHGSAILRKVTIEGADSRSALRAALRRQHLAAFVEAPDDALYAYWVPLEGIYRVEGR